MNQLLSNKFRCTLLLFSALSGLAAALRIFLFRIVAVNMLSYDVFFDLDCFPADWCFLGGLPALLGLSGAVSLATVRKTTSAMLPCLAGFLLPQGNYLFYPCFIIMCGWTALRLVRVYGVRFCRKPELAGPDSGGWDPFYPWILAAVYALAVGWGFYLQYQSARSLFISYADWGIYAESYLRLSSGQASWQEWLSTGSHWNPLVNVIMAGFMRLFRFQEAFFLFTSMLIYTAIPLSWILGRKLGLRPFHAFCCALLAAFCPVYGNLSLCVFYGYHPVYFAIPLILLFFIFRSSGNRTGMILCLIGTLLVKETMMIFWFGYGLWLLCHRRWFPGAVLSAGCLAGFVLLSSWVLPKLVNSGVYPLTFLYSNLGSSPVEVMKSPFEKAEMFLEVCMQWQNYAFALTLLVPFFLLVWLFPDLMIAVLPLLAGFCLRGSTQVKNIALWYGTEISTLLLTLAVMNLNRLRKGENPFWSRLLLSGLPRRCGTVLRLTAFSAAAVLVAVLSHYSFAHTTWGKYSFRYIAEMPDWSPVIRTIRSKLPPGARVLASEKLRSQFMYGHPTADFSYSARPGDFLILALHNWFLDSAEKLENTRRRIAADPKIIPVDSYHLENEYLVVFKVTDGTEKSSVPKLQTIPAKEFAGIGVPLETGNPDFGVRYLYRDNRHVFLIRLNQVPTYDADIELELTGRWGRMETLDSFGWGLYPAYSCPEGAIFILEKAAPPAEQVKVRFKEREGSRFKR